MRNHAALRSLFIAIAAVSAGPVVAQSRCDQLSNWASCLETRASSAVSATIAFSDGHMEYLNPTTSYVNNAPTIINGVTYQDGYGYGTYSGFGLNPDNGPLVQAEYQVASGGSPRSGAYSYDVQQVDAAWLAGGYSNPTIVQDTNVTTRFGGNHGTVQLTGTVAPAFTLPTGNAIHSGFEGTVSQRVLGSAQSIWHDTLTFSASGLVTFDVAVSGTQDAASWWMYGLSAIDGNGASHSLASDFVGTGNAGSAARTLTGTLNVIAGQSYQLGGSLYAYVENAVGLTDISAQLTSIRVAAGNTVTFASNSADWNGVVSTVPEPEVAAMLLAGLAMIGAVVRRRATVAA